MGKAHALSERAIRASGLRRTVLRPSAFFQNFLQLEAPIRRGFLPIAAGRGRASYVDARDVAAVAARVLVEDGHDKATYFLTGPDELSMADIAAALTGAMGRRVRYVNLPKPAYRLSLRLAGLDRWTANGLVAQFAGVVAGGHDIAVTGDVERLTGRPARGFAAFARDFADRLGR